MPGVIFDTYELCMLLILLLGIKDVSCVVFSSSGHLASRSLKRPLSGDKGQIDCGSLVKRSVYIACYPRGMACVNIAEVRLLILSAGMPEGW